MNDDHGVSTVALVHAAASLVLAGIGWVVQVVVYPAFALVPTGAWQRYHAMHGHRIAFVVGPPWLVQGVTTVLLLLDDPGRPLVPACAAAALGGVLLTGGAVCEHRRLAAGVDDAVVRRLLRWNLGRSVMWTAGGVAALVLAAG